VGRGQAEKGTAGLSGPPVPEAPNLCFIASFLLTHFLGRNHVENNAQNASLEMLRNRAKKRKKVVLPSQL